MTTPLFDPFRIVEVFNRFEVDFVVIGGFAAELHAAPVPPTRDIDFAPSMTSTNLARLSRALEDLDARIRVAGIPEGLEFSHDGASLAKANVWNLTCSLGEFDISFKPSGTDGYEDLARQAVRLNVGSHHLSVASLADVIRSKEAAGRPKDFTVLPALLERLMAEEDTPRAELTIAMERRAERRRR